MVLTRKEYIADPEKFAQYLLGKIVVRRIGDLEVSGRIVETEAYLAENDLAAHSSRGLTKRTKAIFGPPGHAYVYSIHRYYCFNTVCSPEGQAGCVLVRALEPLEGIELMKTFRNTADIYNLTSGPGKLCQALDIDLKLYGIDLTADDSPLYLVDDNYKPKQIKATERIGISRDTDLKLRFIIPDNLHISRKS